MIKNRKALYSRVLSCVCAIVVIFMALSLIGCSNPTRSGSSDDTTEAPVIRIGTMPTEDMLPMWIAEEGSIFEQNGLDVEIISFDSAQGLSSAIVAGEVDLAMTDVMRAIKLFESGQDIEIEWVTLGTTPEQGVFGILAPADAPYSTLEEMAGFAISDGTPSGFGVGVAANTVPEYVFDMLCEEAGIEDGAIEKIEVASLPERYGLVSSGNLGAAALPSSLLQLGKSNGLKIIATDAGDRNISQSVMIARGRFADEHQDEIELLARSWDEAVDLLNGSPDAYRGLLAESANINESIIDVYEMSDYPYALIDDKLARISDEYVIPQIAWMNESGYGADGIVYDRLSGRFSQD